MPRKLRIEYEGAIDHVMNRGDRREPIFIDDADASPACAGSKPCPEVCAKTGWQVHAYVLMPNHFDSLAPARSASGPPSMSRVPTSLH